MVQTVPQRLGETSLVEVPPPHFFQTAISRWRPMKRTTVLPVKRSTRFSLTLSDRRRWLSFFGGGPLAVLQLGPLWIAYIIFGQSTWGTSCQVSIQSPAVG